jgi:hypothetical protein
MDYSNIQVELCKQYGTDYVFAPEHMKVGITQNVKTGLQPVNGLRHLPVGDTSGWYIWAGEDSFEDPDFFLPLHIEHLPQWCPQIIKFLALPPGYRFLIAEGYEDVWEDKSLLDV